VGRDQDVPVLGGEAPQRLFENPTAHRSVELVDGNWLVTFAWVGMRDDGRSDPSMAVQVDAGVPADRVQPPLLRTITGIERVRRPPRPYERLLHGFLGQTQIVQHTPGEGMQTCSVHPIRRIDPCVRAQVEHG
jgi:hypothetical protein